MGEHLWSVHDTLHWMSVALMAGVALHAWVKDRDKPLGCFFAGASLLTLSRQLDAFVVIGFVLLLYGGCAILRRGPRPTPH